MSKLDSIVEELIKTAEDAINTNAQLTEKTAAPTIKSELANSLIKVAKALKEAKAEVTVDEVKESIK